MSVEATFGNHFKPELKSSGRKLVAQEKVSLSSQSDTFIQAYVRVSPPFKVTLSSEDISAPSFVAECNCPVAKKSRFCKHIWATLLTVENECPDFLSSKTEIEKPGEASEKEPTRQETYQEAAKQRASDYRKAQYQKQKTSAKEKKRTARGLDSASASPYSAEVEASLVYFSINGFPMKEGPSREILSEAKRKLSRVFHPDKGGTHEESVELNRNCEVLLAYFREGA